MWTSTLGQFCVTAIPDERILLSVAGPPASTIGSGPDGRPILPDAHERQTKNNGAASRQSDVRRQEKPKGSKKQSACHACSAQGYGTRDARIRRGMELGDIAEGLLSFLGRGLWWWWWTALTAVYFPTYS